MDAKAGIGWRRGEDHLALPLRNEYDTDMTMRQELRQMSFAKKMECWKRFGQKCLPNPEASKFRNGTGISLTEGRTLYSPVGKK